MGVSDAAGLIVTSAALTCALLRDLFGTPQMRAVFDSRQMVQRWLDVEAALARAEARVGVVPAVAAARITREADAARFDLDALRDGIAESQHPLVPAIRELTRRCEEHGAHVHWGATTQDIIDTGCVLQIRDAATVLDADLERAVVAATRLAHDHAASPMAGRTHGQHAVPITFGLKAASWADELGRCRARLHQVVAGLPVQLAGAAGTLASLGADAARVHSAMADELGLPDAVVPWHVARDRVRDLGHALNQVGGAGERIAAEVIRLQATEVGEVLEPAGDRHVGSSTMPQKRNPMTSEYLVASARCLRGAVSPLTESPAHAGERDMALWATEWLAVPSAFILAASVADKLATILAGLEVRPQRMRDNLALTNGAVMAEAAMMTLARYIGHASAHHVVARAAMRAAAEGQPLLSTLLEDPDVERCTLAELARAMHPEGYLGWSQDVARGAGPEAAS